MKLCRGLRTSHRTRRRLAGAAGTAAIVALAGLNVTSASAATATVGLATVAPFSVLGASTVTNTGPSTLSGDLGVSPGTAITGFPPGTAAGATHATDAVAAQAKSDLGIAYDDAAGRASTAAVAGDLVGTTLVAGVYTSTGPLALSGTVTFDGQGNPDSVFIVQIAKTLITASASRVATINGANACHIFWQVGSSATLGTASTFQGTVLALASISVTTSVHIKGRTLARTGAVTLDNDVFTDPNCTDDALPSAATPTTTSITAVPATSTPGGTVTVTVTATVHSATGTPTGSVTFTRNGIAVGTAPVTAAGTASITVPAGSGGGPMIFLARYNGSPDVAPSTSSAATVRVALTVPRAPVVPSASASAPSVARRSVPDRG